MDHDVTQLIAQVEDAQRRFEEALERSGLSMARLRELADQIRHKLPAAERRRVEAAAQAIAPRPRRRPGTSALSIPIGIRG
jgi:hypothetical protein